MLLKEFVIYQFTVLVFSCQPDVTANYVGVTENEFECSASNDIAQTSEAVEINSTEDDLSEEEGKTPDPCQTRDETPHSTNNSNAKKISKNSRRTVWVYENVLKLLSIYKAFRKRPKYRAGRKAIMWTDVNTNTTNRGSYHFY